MPTFATPLRLPGIIARSLDAAARDMLRAAGPASVDFAQPAGEPALVPADSVSWCVFKNPVALFVGGVAAVILELAEPSVRTGVWEHTSFRKDPVTRLRRTGVAAMVTVYGARSVAEPMIARVVRAHGQVEGRTPDGLPYSASDPRLLTWVQATAGYGFAQAYSRFVRTLSVQELEQLVAEGAESARLYGATDMPDSQAGIAELFEAMRGRLEASPIVFEFLEIMRRAPALPAPLRPVQALLVRAAVEITPPWVRETLGLDRHYGLRPFEAALLRRAGQLSDRIVVRSSPPVQACLRLGLPEDFLYRG